VPMNDSSLQFKSDACVINNRVSRVASFGFLKQYVVLLLILIIAVLLLRRGLPTGNVYLGRFYKLN
jgi:hypothetical protein